MWLPVGWIYYGIISGAYPVNSTVLLPQVPWHFDHNLATDEGK